MTRHRTKSSLSQTRRKERAIAATEPDTDVESSYQIAQDDDSTTWRERKDEELTAPVQLPSQEAMTVKLRPLNLIERLEEYQSDENLCFTFIGLFAGAVLGILSNWVTGEDFYISRISIALIIILFICVIGATLWLMRIRNRTKAVKKKLFEGNER